MQCQYQSRQVSGDVYVLKTSILPLSTIVLLDFGTVSTVWYFLFFILSINNQLLFHCLYILFIVKSSMLVRVDVLGVLLICYLVCKNIYRWYTENTIDLSQLTDKLYHIILYTSPWLRFELTTLVVIDTDCLGSCKSNYYTITATASPLNNHVGIHQIMEHHKCNNFWETIIIISLWHDKYWRGWGVPNEQILGNTVNNITRQFTKRVTIAQELPSIVLKLYFLDFFSYFICFVFFIFLDIDACAFKIYHL